MNQQDRLLKTLADLDAQMKAAKDLAKKVAKLEAELKTARGDVLEEVFAAAVSWCPPRSVMQSRGRWGHDRTVEAIKKRVKP